MAGAAYCEIELTPPAGMSAGIVAGYIHQILGGCMAGPGGQAVTVEYVGDAPFRKARIRVTGSDDTDHFRKAITDGVISRYWDID